VYTIITWGWIGIGIGTFILLVVTNIRAPYGRHTRKGWGPLIANRWGWFLMELPALLIMPLLALTGPNRLSPVSFILVSLWLIHYVNRTLIFPFRIKTSGKKMPLSIILSAMLFNIVNGALNGYFLGYLAKPNHEFSLLTVIGLAIFILGMAINWTSDNYLIGLRKNAEGYHIPRGGLFRLISCPNHFGEIIEWIGFALIAWNLPALSFAMWTGANLIPRALNHHQWYKENFVDYPAERKAVLPFLL
jgi:3-oxo-5-alpha-steroid 4-dehydrogenase 1